MTGGFITENPTAGPSESWYCIGEENRKIVGLPNSSRNLAANGGFQQTFRTAKVVSKQNKIECYNFQTPTDTVSWVLQLPISSLQAPLKIEASHRPQQTQLLSHSRKVQNGNTRVHQGLSDSRGMGVIERFFRRLLHIPIHPA